MGWHCACAMAHRARQREKRLLAGQRWIGEAWGLDFANVIGGPLDPSHAVVAFKKHLTRAELPNLRVHDLRHSCASLLVVQEFHARTVMNLLGHSTIKLTMGTYAHIMPEQHRQAAALMEGLFGVPETEAS